MNVRFPDVCCWCLSDTQDREAISNTAGAPAHVPLCAPCRAHWRRRRSVIGWVCVSLAAALFAVWVLATRPEIGLELFQSVTLAFFVWLFAHMFALTRFGYPIRTSMPSRYDRDKVVERILFKNPDYLKYLTPDRVSPANAPVSRDGIPFEFPMPPRSLKPDARPPADS